MSLSNKTKNYIRKHYSKKSAAKIASDLNVEESEVQEFIEEISEPLPFKKKVAFYAITVSIPILFFVILEVTLRGIDYMGNTELFIDPNIPSEEYLMPNPNFASRYFFYTKTIPNPSVDVFLKDKPENSYRVFAMGGSSAAGYPYGYNGTFSRLVDDVLADAMPSREVEIVNVATSAISTYTLFDQVDEILEQKPDAIMIYAGHNEFYGALGVGSNENLGAFPGFVRTYLKLQRFKTFLFLRELIVDAGQWIFGSNGSAGGTLMERIISDQSIELDGPEYQLAMKQFQSNMEAIISAFHDQDIPVYLSTIASNVKDQPPFVTVEQEDHPAASVVYNKALESYAEGDTASAKSQFEYAKDLDGLKFRAPSGINKIIKQLAQDFDNVRLVDTHQTMEMESPDGIIGENLMLEHLHPNQTGYYLMGRSFSKKMLEELSGSGLVEDQPSEFESYFDEMFITEFDDRIVHHRLRTLKQGFPFVINQQVNPYQFNYQPSGIMDSLAFGVVHKDIRWDAAKVELAQYYQREGESEKALQEYFSLIRNQPWNDSPYVFAARIYLNQNDFKNAEPLLEKAYELAPKEAFTTKMLGAIKLNKGQTQQAIKYLEESRALNPNDPQMLYNLSGAYGTNQEFQKALEIADQVIELNPNFPGIQQWRAQLIQILNRQNN
ncbi:GDSL-type esterase/lipase family protein [Gracilimonas tropica]|uniref:GDSL-type esterase/lipase family protein n=1 Tax=Gracilimonas tropica TaxID=454600 RepID=UPI00036E1E7F|nr:tetratricopeptide repeat protein [Gracilimonas tropica]